MKNLLTAVMVCFSGLFQACATEPTEPVTVLQNEAIDAKTRSQIQSLNTRLLDGIMADDPAPMRELFVDEVLAAIESGPGLDQVFAQIRGALTETVLQPFHEFDITLNGPQEDTLEIPAEGGRGFSLELAPSSHRMHVSLVEARAGFRDHLVGLVYTRPAGAAPISPPDDGWRLQALRVGALRAGGKTALDWYAEARRFDELGFYIPAAVRLMVANDLLRPVPFLRYDDETRLQEFERQVGNTLASAHDFPLELSALPGPPRIIRLDSVFQRQQLLTLVSYVTTRKLEQATIEAEVKKVQKALVELFPGLCHEATRVAYKAFAEPPLDRTKAYPSINAVTPCP